MGGLAYQIVSTPFTGGVETKVTPHQVPPAKLLQLVNMVMVKKGAIQTRNGSVALSNLSGLTSSSGLMTYKNQLIANGQYAGSAYQYAYSPAENNWTELIGPTYGKQPVQILKPQGITGNTFDHDAADLATSNGVTVVAYEENSNLCAVVIDENTGSVLLNVVLQAGTPGAAPTAPRVAALGTTITVCYLYNNKIYGSVLTLSAVSSGFSASALIQDSHDGSHVIAYYEARPVVYGVHPYIALVWYETGVNTHFFTAGWDPTTLTTYIALATSIAITGAAHPGMWVLEQSRTAYILIAQVPAPSRTSSPITIEWYDLTLASVVGPYTLDTTSIGWGNITAAMNSNAAGPTIFYEEGGQGPLGGTFTPPTVKCTITNFAASGGTALGVITRGSAISGDAFVMGPSQTGQVELPINWVSAIQPTYFLVNTLGGVVAKMQQGNAGGQSVRYNCPQIAVDPEGNYMFAYLPRAQSTADYENNLEIIRSVQKCSLSFGVAPPVSAVLGQNLNLSGGHLASYDGYSFSEENFHLFPEMPTSGLYSGSTDFPYTMGAVYGCPISAIRTQMGLPSANNVNTTIAAGSNMVSLPTNTISLTSTTGMPASGYITVTIGGSPTIIGYTGLGAGNTITGCTGGSGTLLTAQVVISSATAEITTISLPPPQLSPDGTVFGTGWMIQPGSYFTFWIQEAVGSNVQSPAYVYFTVDGVGTDPALYSAWVPPGSGGDPTFTFQCGILSSDTDLVILQRIQEALSASSLNWGYLQVSGSVGSCTLTIGDAIIASTAAGPGACASDLFGCTPVAYGAVGSVCPYAYTLITCPAGNRIMPGGYFVIPSLTFGTAYVVYFVVDGVGQQPDEPNVPQTGGVQWGADFKSVSIASTATPAQVQAQILTSLGAGSSSTYSLATFSNQTYTPNTMAPFIYLMNYSHANEYIPAYNVNASGWAIEANQGGVALTAVAGAVPGNGVPSVWYYQETFERYDAQGQLNRSAPSLPSPCFVNGAFQGTVNGFPTGGCLPRMVLPPCQLSDQAGYTGLVVYRSEINPSTQPVQYFRASGPTFNYTTASGANWTLSSSSNSPLLQGPIPNVTTAAQPFIDIVTDALIAGNPQLYTAQQVANNSPPAPVAIATHRGRLFVVPSETPNELWYSQTYIPGGGVTYGFNSLLTQPVDTAGGDMVGLCSMDDKLVIGTQTRMYYMTGDGPNAFGQNSNFSAPTLLSADVGVLSANSMVLMGQGVMFQSQKGIYLAGRDLSCSYIGAPVESYVQGNIVTSAVLMPDRNEVRFGLNNGTIVVYQDLFNQWYTITGWGGAATIWQGQYAFQEANGQSFVETTGATTDGGAAINWTAQTAWIPFGGLQGYQRASRFLVLGSSANPITVTAAFNYNPALTDPPYTYTPNPANPEQFRAWIGNQLCESISLTFTGQGVQMLEDLSLELGGIRGIMRLGPAQTGHGG